jgi:hypothetical protein
MQQQVRTSHFSRATLYALMANCLQFQKEGQANPGNAGVSKTRAMVCELLAIKLLKEYSTRELIDALSYDFFPLQGFVIPTVSTPGNPGPRGPSRPAAARTSTLEVAIRASAKKFLAHPLVVQQLEAIWAGTIVFHSAADNLHRVRATTRPVPPRRTTDDRRHLLVPGQQTTYGAVRSPDPRSSPDKQVALPLQMRRTVTLYDPRDASLFKLSRLRVPRYRQFFSTCSLAILLGLFVAVLAQRSSDITGLELIFWFWSAGFMLDELVGFNEQGFSLYIMSFWNTFDLGILLLLIVYYSMRLYGLLLVDLGRHEWDSMAYDVLATNAILLFPRLFSVLDHYRYFSQLLIAFRLMAVDLIAVFVLILIACSGFFVAFTLSFKRNGTGDYDAAGVAYKIFQILMGFTPAAWDSWPTYNPLGKAILVLFLFICHFLVVTILITVLTNSFMAIVSNANDEHQFVFAVNTISMVKNDALFSYVAPSNIFAWLLVPLRFGLPFRSFIRLNRTAIKVTHFPLLFAIYAYEKTFLASTVFDPTDLVEQRGRRRQVSFNESKALFSPNVRQSSIGGFQQDRALDEVFRLAPRPNTMRSNTKSVERHNVVNNWMDHQGDHASPPQEQNRSVVDRLETRRKARKTTMLRHRGISGTRSVASDPAEFMSTGPFHDAGGNISQFDNDMAGHEEDADGDDELVTNDDDDHITLDKSRSHPNNSDKGKEDDDDDDYFRTPTGGHPNLPSISSLKKQQSALSAALKSSPPRFRGHNRNMSTNTIVFNPLEAHTSSSDSPPKSRPLTAKRTNTVNTGTHTPATNVVTGNRTPKPSIYTTAHTKARPILPNRQNFQSVPNFNVNNTVAGSRTRQLRRRQSSLDMAMSDLGFDQNPSNMLGAVPSSFATQMAMATGGLKGPAARSAGRQEDTDGMMGRLMLARMKTLEEGFAEVVKEFRGMRTAGNSSVEGGEVYGSVEGRREKGKGREKIARKKKDGRGVLSRGVSAIGISEVDFVNRDSVIRERDVGGDGNAEKEMRRENVAKAKEALVPVNEYDDTPEDFTASKYMGGRSSF